MPACSSGDSQGQARVSAGRTKMKHGGIVDAILNALGDQHAELDALLQPLDDHGWSRPTRCDGWTVADVVLHLAQTDQLALASAQGRFADGLAVLAHGLEGTGNVDDGAAAMVERERGIPNPVLYERWRAGTAALRDT